MSNKKLVVITGASAGIGLATAQEFSRLGHPLLLLSRRSEPMKALNLPNTISESVDITDYEAVKKAIKNAEAKYGEVDCLINNAGRMLLGEFDKQDRHEWSDMFSLNVIALMEIMQLVLPGMRKRRSGTIFNVGSVAGKRVYPNNIVYSSSKFAVHAVTEGVRELVAEDNIRVILIAPGAVKTELTDHTTNPNIRKGLTDWLDTFKNLDSEDIARSIAFYYSEPQYVNPRELVIAPTQQKM